MHNKKIVVQHLWKINMENSFILTQYIRLYFLLKYFKSKC